MHTHRRQLKIAIAHNDLAFVEKHIDFSWHNYELLKFASLPTIEYEREGYCHVDMIKFFTQLQGGVPEHIQEYYFETVITLDQLENFKELRQLFPSTYEHFQSYFLLCASEIYEHKIFDYLLEQQNLDLHYDEITESSLYMAFYQGHYNKAEKLIARGHEVDRDFYSEQFHEYIWQYKDRSSLGALTRLLALGVQPLRINESLKKACQFNISALIEPLVKLGANPHWLQDSPLMSAFVHNSVDCFILLVKKYGANLHTHNDYFIEQMSENRVELSNFIAEQIITHESEKIDSYLAVISNQAAIRLFMHSYLERHITGNEKQTARKKI